MTPALIMLFFTLSEPGARHGHDRKSAVTYASVSWSKLDKLDLKLKHARCSEEHCKSNKRSCRSAKACVKLRRVLRERLERREDSMLECLPHDGNHSTNRRRCKHKPLWPRVIFREYAAAALVFVVGALAASGGIGGGGLFVPVLNLMLRFDPHTCTALSQSLICGAAIGGFLVNAPARHPYVDRPLIDVRVTTFLAPCEMAGAQLGVLLNQMLPSLVIFAAMAIVLTITGVQTLRKGCQMYARERQSAGEGGLRATEMGVLLTSTEGHAAHDAAHDAAHEHSKRARSPRASSETLAAAPAPACGEGAGAAAGSHAARPPPAAPQPASFSDAAVGELLTQLGAWLHSPLQPPPLDASATARATLPRVADLEAEEARVPALEAAMLMLTWAGFLALLLARGGKGVPSPLGLGHCSAAYWAVTAAGFLLLLGVSLASGRRLVARAQLNEAVGRQPAEGDIAWDRQRAAQCMRWTLCAGIVAGLVGVGGGMLLGPLMLQMGVLPQVSAATTGTMILLTSSSAAALLLTAGHSPLDYSLAFGLVTTVGAYLGKRVVSLLVRRFQCASLIVLVLGGLITASVAAIGTAGALDLLEKLEAGELLSSLVLRFPCVGP